MEELKMGDEIKIKVTSSRGYTWEEGIFIKYSSRIFIKYDYSPPEMKKVKGIICVTGKQLKKYLVGLPFVAIFVSEGQWKPRTVNPAGLRRIKMIKLRMSDEVYVFISNWIGYVKRIFLKYGTDGSIIVVSHGFEERYKNGDSFETIKILKEFWKPIAYDESGILVNRDVKYREITYEESDILINKVIMRKNHTGKTLILSTDLQGVTLISYGRIANITYDILLLDYLFCDTGEPCGIKR